MSEYQATHRDRTAQAGRWVPLVIYGVMLAGMAALLAGWWS